MILYFMNMICAIAGMKREQHASRIVHLLHLLLPLILILILPLPLPLLLVHIIHVCIVMLRGDVLIIQLMGIVFKHAIFQRIVLQEHLLLLFLILINVKRVVLLQESAYYRHIIEHVTISVLMILHARVVRNILITHVQVLNV